MFANLEVATGQIIAPTIGPTRKEADFTTHIAQTIDTDPAADWIFIVDGLTAGDRRYTHQSEMLVRLVAQRCQITAGPRREVDLGEKGKWGILKSMQTRRQFLQQADHRIRFVS